MKTKVPRVPFFVLFFSLVAACAGSNDASTERSDFPGPVEANAMVGINATLGCVNAVGENAAEACAGVTAIGETNAVISCLNVVKDAEACAGVKSIEQVNVVFQCVRLVGEKSGAACSGVKTVDEMNAVLSCVRLIPKASIACSRR